MIKRVFISLIATLTIVSALATAAPVQAAGVSASGGGTRTVGQNFTVTVTASGVEFDSLQGVISVSGPVTVVSFAGGGATWLPGKAPSNGGQFVGITSPTRNLTVATITLKGAREGRGAVSVSAVRLARNGQYVGNAGGSTAFTIVRAPTPPGGVEVSSPTHPDQNVAYVATTAEVIWKAPVNGANGYSVIFDQAAETVPGPTITTRETSAKYENLAVGTHFFHIRANNADGWGPTTHFKITIREPDPKIDETLAKTTISSIRLADAYINDVETGTVAGVVFEGTTVIGFIANIALQPKPELPAEAKLSSEISADGAWRLQLDAPIPAGFYTVTVQGQNDKILTPVSDAMRIQISVAEGGSLRVITAADKDIPPRTDIVTVMGVTVKKQTLNWSVVGVLNLLALGGLFWFLLRRQRLSATSTETKKFL